MRWRILDKSGGYLCYRPEKVAKIALSCCILHNLCRRRNVPMPNLPESNDVIHDDSDEASSNETYPTNTANRNGQIKRNQIVQTFE